jgi:hypothetical protein
MHNPITNWYSAYSYRTMGTVLGTNAGDLLLVISLQPDVEAATESLYPILLAD